MNFNDNDFVFFDLEADGLRPTRIHCLVCKRGDQVDVIDNPRSYLHYLRNNSDAVFVGHNAIGYDFRVLHKLWGSVPEKRLDSLVLSRLASPSRDGGHSLAAWGATLGFPKGDYTGPWDVYSASMLEYCIRDVEVLEKVFSTLITELKDFSQESIELEHQVAEIIQKQMEFGWLFDEDEGRILYAKLKEELYKCEDKVRETFIPLPTFVKEITPKIKKDGTMSVVGLKFLGDRWTEVGGTFSRIDFPQFNLGSRQQIGKHLIHYGWKPKEFTETGQPKVDETVLMEVEGIPEASLIAEYLMLQKRLGMVESWLEAVQDDGRIHGRVRTNGAITGRMTHDSPNVAQVPAVKAPWGAECRSLWTVPEGFSLVGCDASGLELRMLAHYMDDEDYTNELLSGDIHTVNQLAAGLPTRDSAKTFIYAFLYGAGDAKIGTIVGGTARDGRELKRRFLANTPSLERLRDRVTKASSRGYLRGLDGRHIYVRSQHAALNSLLQGAGAVVMKKALVILEDFIPKWKLQAMPVGNIHDEVQYQVVSSQAHKFGGLAVASIQASGQAFNLRCPLDGDYKVGANWKETH